jgi:hypothetical protein
MTFFDVSELSALEILDSRGRPTLAVTVTLADNTSARAGVPSGASTGSREAVELRDGDKSRYAGLGVLTAAANVNGEISDLLRGRSWTSLAEADQAVIDLDGTPNKARLGANATVGVSMALARALAQPNLIVKVSGYYYGAGRPWDFPFTEHLEIVRAFYETWGPGRMAWASDYPACTPHISYRQSLEVIREHADFIDPADLALVLGGTMAAVIDRARR